jgi:hypothetical protein
VWHFSPREKRRWGKSNFVQALPVVEEIGIRWLFEIKKAKGGDQKRIRQIRCEQVFFNDRGLKASWVKAVSYHHMVKEVYEWKWLYRAKKDSTSLRCTGCLR